MLECLRPINRWTPRRRRDVVWSISRGLTSIEEVALAHALEPTLVAGWLKRQQPEQHAHKPRGRIRGGPHPPYVMPGEMYAYVAKRLTQQEVELLQAIAKGHGLTVTTNHLVHVLGSTVNHLKVMICHIRKKLHQGVIIKCDWGLGYRLIQEGRHMGFDTIETLPKAASGRVRETQASVGYRRSKKAKVRTMPNLVIGVPAQVSNKLAPDFRKFRYALQVGRGTDFGKARIVRDPHGVPVATTNRGGLVFRFGYVPYLGDEAAEKEYCTVQIGDLTSSQYLVLDLPAWFKPVKKVQAVS